MTTALITLDDVAAAVGAAVAFELGLAVRSPGASALTSWWLEDADDLEGERLSGALDILAWETASHFENLFGPVPAPFPSTVVVFRPQGGAM